MTGVVEIPLANGRGVALVDAPDAPVVAEHPWCLMATDGQRYAFTKIGRRSTVMHRLILDPPRGVYVDHINRDGLDNRRANLRLATASQNAANTRMRCTNTSGYRGIAFTKGAWQVVIGRRASGAPGYVGRYPTAEEAARAYDDVARVYFGEFATLNFPDEAAA